MAQAGACVTPIVFPTITRYAPTLVYAYGFTLIEFLTSILHGKEKLAQPFFFCLFPAGHSTSDIPLSFRGFLKHNGNK